MSMTALGLWPCVFAALQAPEQALGGVAGDGKVGDLHIGEILVNLRLAAGIALRVGIGAQQFGDGVANEHDVVVAALGQLNERGMPAAALRRTNAGIVRRHLNGQKRFVLLQQVLVGRGGGFDKLFEVSILFASSSPVGLGMATSGGTGAAHLSNFVDVAAVAVRRR